MDESDAVLSGTRRENSRTRSFNLPLAALVTEDGSADLSLPDAYGRAAAPRWYAVVREGDGLGGEHPGIGDTLQFHDGDRFLKAAVGNVEHHLGYYVLNLRER